MIKGTPKTDGIALMEVSSISFLAGAANPKMRARFAYIKSTTGSTLGAFDHENWSSATLAALTALRDCMERDVAAIYLTATSDGATLAGIPQGIVDHVGTEDVPSV